MSWISLFLSFFSFFFKLINNRNLFLKSSVGWKVQDQVTSWLGICWRLASWGIDGVLLLGFRKSEDMKDLPGAPFIRALIPLAQMVKCLPAWWESWVRSLGQEDALEKEMATHSSTLAWKISWMEESGGLQSMGPQRVGHYIYIYI